MRWNCTRKARRPGKFNRVGNNNEPIWQFAMWQFASLLASRAALVQSEVKNLMLSHSLLGRLLALVRRVVVPRYLLTGLTGKTLNLLQNVNPSSLVQIWTSGVHSSTWTETARGGNSAVQVRCYALNYLSGMCILGRSFVDGLVTSRTAITSFLLGIQKIRAHIPVYERAATNLINSSHVDYELLLCRMSVLCRAPTNQ